jgi:uncharacterized protein
LELSIGTILIALLGVFFIAFMKGTFGGGFAVIGIPMLSQANRPVRQSRTLGLLCKPPDLRRRDGPAAELRNRCYLAQMKLAGVNTIMAAVADWALMRDDMRAMAMLGSWVRGNPRPDSDLDLLLLSDLARDYQRCRTWLTEIDFRSAGFRLRSNESAIYGVAWSQHVYLLPAAEVELTFAKCSWANTDPVDTGTRVVVKDAFRIIFDRDGILAKLVGAVNE